MTDREKELQKIIQKYQTPFYLYDITGLKERIQLIRQMLPDIGVCFAMKAAPMLAGSLAETADRLEVCSPGEYEICRRAGIEPGKVLVSGVNKTMESIRSVLNNGGANNSFTIESPAHFKILETCAKEAGVRADCYIRLSSGNQFGVDRETFEILCRKVMESEHLTFLGIHYFSGTQKNEKRIETELQELSEYGKHLETLTGRKTQLEYGPGLSVHYFREKEEEKEGQTQADALFEGVCQETSEAKKKLEILAGIVARTGLTEAYAKVTFEYGRFIAANSGFYFTKIVDSKTTNGVNYTILDGGLHQISYYGSMAGMKVPYIGVLPKQERSQAALKEYVLAGSLCSVNDILVRKAVLPELQTGDVLGFGLAGAYASTEGLSLFLSRDLPAVVIKDEQGNTSLLRDHMETNGFNDGIRQ
ncbi:MAG: diaminopimelate decarboxylase [Lachnospiraceae bacterium]|jgi:diaminopimelate decarboxylase|nr:diaminopimelate decarboxylase [Lachnospiraceae bacterium]